MPIFTKDKQRVYFAHIPKTAGSFIYTLFLDNGWDISHLRLGARGGISRILRKRYGIESVETPNEIEGLTKFFQHAEARHWQHWGPFDSSFAVLRDPIERCRSEVRYVYGFQKRSETIQEFKDKWLTEVRHKLIKDPDVVGGHFIPQVNFVSKDTQLYFYQNSWLDELCAKYGLLQKSSKRVNQSTLETFDFSDEEIDWLKGYYTEDYKLIEESFVSN
ncbi:MAG: hypothetical protein AAF198_08465 [Pseudomonadota bacterium]